MKPRVLVVGGTPAGLTAALLLGRQGYTVTLLEHPERLDDGYADSRFGGDDVPQTLIGCHAATRSLLDTLGVAQHVVFSNRVCFELLGSGGAVVPFRRAFLPAPWHALAGLAMFSGMPARDRWRFLSWIERTWERDPALPIDLESHTGEAWLRSIGQSETARISAWTPLSRFLLGDDVKTVSAAALLTALMHVFLFKRRDSAIILPSRSMGEALERPMREALARLPVSIESSESRAVERIGFNRQGVTGIQLAEGTSLSADWYIVALPHPRVTPLLPEGVLTRFSYFQQIETLIDTPAMVVHHLIDRPIRFPRLILMSGRTFHWMCLRPTCDATQTWASLVLVGQPGWAEWANRPDEDILACARRDLSAAVPQIVNAPHRAYPYRIIRQPRTFLSMRPGATARRPLQQSPFSNLLLAGEWTDTGLPATLESAITSANRCVSIILEKDGLEKGGGGVAPHEKNAERGSHRRDPRSDRVR